MPQLGKIDAQKVADRVWRLTGGTMVFEFDDHLTLFELAGGPAGGQARIDFAATLAPGKPVTELILSHNHFDHITGIRAAVANGLTIIARAGTEGLLRELAVRPAPNYPDRLARNPRPLKFIPVEERLRLQDRALTVDVYPIVANNHIAEGVFAFVPSSKVFVEGDIATAAEEWQFWADSYMDNVEHYKLDVEILAPVHARVMTHKEVLAYIAPGRARVIQRCEEFRKRGDYLPGCPRFSRAADDRGQIMGTIGPVLCGLLTLAAVVTLAAGQPPAASEPDLEGGWVRVDVDGSGSFNGLAAKFARAVLTPTAQAAAAEQAKRAAQPRFDFARDPSQPRRAGDGYVVTDGSCTLPGGVEPNSAAFHIVQSRDQVLVVRENPGLPRTIYLDGRAHPDLSRLTPTAVGHSTGRYERGRAGRRDDRPCNGQRDRGRVAHARNATDRALPPVAGWPAAHHQLHLAGPEGVREAAHVRDPGRAHAARQLGVRIVVRFERSQSAAVDRAAAAEPVMRTAMRRTICAAIAALVLVAGAVGRAECAGHQRVLGTVVRQPPRAGREPHAGRDAGADGQAGGTRRTRHSLVQLPGASGGDGFSPPDQHPPGAPRDRHQFRDRRDAAPPVLSLHASEHGDLRSDDQRRFHRTVGGRHAGRRHDRIRRRQRCDHDSGWRLPDLRLASRSSGIGC